MTWIALHEEVPDFQAVLEGVSIFGHKTWTLFNDTKVFNSEMISKGHSVISILLRFVPVSTLTPLCFPYQNAPRTSSLVVTDTA